MHGTGRDTVEPTLSDERLADEITTLAAHLSAAMARWLSLVAQFDERRAWAGWGCQSCSHWLGWRCSIAPSAAREHVRVARCLSTMPVIQAAFARGELSYSKVRAITRLGAIEDEDALVELARVHTAAQLERVVRATRRVGREEAQAAYDERFLTLDPSDDGTVAVRGRLTAEDAAVLQRALDLARESLGAEDDRGETTAANLRADALVRMADSVLMTGVGGRPTADRHEVVVHVDAELLVASGTGTGTPDATSEPSGASAIDGDLPIATETAGRLCCDVGIVVQLERGGEPLAIGRRSRTVPSAVRRALRAVGDGCAFPGCTNTRWLDAHHIRHWADGGPTDLDNLVLLCAHHHRLVHEHGYRIEVTDPPASDAHAGRFRGSARRGGGRRGRLRFSTPHGRPLPPVPATGGGDAGALVDGHRAAGVDPGPDTTVPGWAGERLDLGLSVDAFLGRLQTSSRGDDPRPDDPRRLDG